MGWPSSVEEIGLGVMRLVDHRFPAKVGASIVLYALTYIPVLGLDLEWRDHIRGMLFMIIALWVRSWNGKVEKLIPDELKNRKGD